MFTDKKTTQLCSVKKRKTFPDPHKSCQHPFSLKSNTMLIKNDAPTLRLVHDHFQADEARDLIDQLINDRVRQHKILMLRRWERNHRYDAKPANDRLQLLQTQGQEIQRLIAQAKQLGLDIEIKASIEVRVVSKLAAEAAN
jgi:uncharacterized protein YmfQ (DUF2313 family)